MMTPIEKSFNERLNCLIGWVEDRPEFDGQVAIGTVEIDDTTFQLQLVLTKNKSMFMQEDEIRSSEAVRVNNDD